jgi:integration host factor subunit beta
MIIAIFNSIVRALRSGDKLEIRGFGSFRMRLRQARTGRNPKTGVRVDVPAKRIPYFTHSKEVKLLISNSGSGSVPPPSGIPTNSSQLPLKPHSS